MNLLKKMCILYQYAYVLRRPYNYSTGQAPYVNACSNNRTLFKTSFINAQKQHMQSMPVYDQAETEIWRSETFLQVL